MEIDFHRAHKSSSVLRERGRILQSEFNRYASVSVEISYLSSHEEELDSSIKKSPRNQRFSYRSRNLFLNEKNQLSSCSLSKKSQTPSRVPSRENCNHCFPNEATRDYEGERSWASLLRLSVGDGVALLDGDGDGAAGVEDLGTVAV